MFSLQIFKFLIRFLIIIPLVLGLTACPDSGGGGGGVSPPPTGSSIQISWNPNPETAVNRSGGGYRVYYSTISGFNPGDGGVTEIDVPYSSGVSAPTSALINYVNPGTYYIRISAYSALNAPGTSGGSTSTATSQFTLTIS